MILYIPIGQEIEIIATVMSDKAEKEYKTVYKIRVDKIKDRNKSKYYQGSYLLLNIKKSDKMQELKYGSQIKIYGEYIEPDEARNENGFSYKNYLKSIKVYGTINSSKIEIMKENNINYIIRFCNFIKNQIKEKIQEMLPDEPGDLLLGILIGDDEYIDKDTMNYFKVSNLYHILAVSGAHISYIILGMTFLLNKICPNKKLIYMLTILSLLFFMGMIGYSPSVVRAVIMGIILLGSYIVNRKLDISNSIGVSILIILMNNPFMMYHIGFWLSYGGTIGIICFSKMIKEGLIKKEEKHSNQMVIYKNKKVIEKVKQSILEMFCITISAQIMILPIIVLNYNTISLTFWISNLLAGYLIGGITIGGFVFSIISFFSKTLACMIAFPLNLIIQLLLNISKFSSYLPLSQIYVITPNFILVIFYYMFLFILFLYFYFCKKQDLSYIQKKILHFMNKTKNRIKEKKKQILGMVVIILFIFVFYSNIPKDLRIYFIDIGQGDSTLIITPQNKKILIDSGGSTLTNEFDVGEKTLLPYLLNRGVRTIDYIMISHFDADHCNGFIKVLENLNVKKVIIGKQCKISGEYTNLMEVIKEKKIPVIVVKEKDRIYLDSYTYLDILYPKEHLEFDDLNENSIVAKLQYYNFSMLFTGDLGIEGEKKLLEKFSEKDLSVDILKVGHHGSKGSSSEQFLKTVRPKVALIGVSSKNTFGHPSQIVIDRLNQMRH